MQIVHEEVHEEARSWLFRIALWEFFKDTTVTQFYQLKMAIKKWLITSLQRRGWVKICQENHIRKGIRRNAKKEPPVWPSLVKMP